jgi:subtilisin family serine protease
LGIRPILSRLMVLILLLTAVLPAAAAPTPATASAQSAASAQGGGLFRKEKLHPKLREQVDAAPADARFTVVIRGKHKANLDALQFRHDDVVAGLKEAASRSQASITGYLRTRGAMVLNQFWLINGVVARVDGPTLQGLTALDDVALIYENFPVAAPPVTRSATPAAGGDLTWGLAKIEADRVWNELGFTGEGVRVAVLDTGVDIGHPDIAGKMYSDNPGDPTYPGGWIEFNGDGQAVSGSQPHDSDAHGTHTSGTVAGGNASGTHIGVAPGVSLMHGLILPGGGGTFAQVVAGMQWAVQPTDSAGNPAGQPANIASMSFGAEGLRSEVVEPIRNMYTAGVLPIAAIGNCGGDCVGSPGAVYEAFGIGASTETDGIAEFSSGALIRKDGWENPPDEWPEFWIKPDLSAPGVNVVSSVPGGGYDSWAGTSMATPHAAGTAALMLSASPGLTPDIVLETLKETSFWDNRYGDERPNTRFGFGRINAYEAVSRVAYNSGITGLVTDGSNGHPLDQAVVKVDGMARQAKSGADGTYNLVLPPGTYSLTVERFGYATALLENITVTDGQKSTANAALQRLPRGRIRGRVNYDRSGIGIPGMSLKVIGVPIKIEAATDVDGVYELDLPVGAYDLQVTGHGFGQASASGLSVPADGVTEMDFRVGTLPKVAVVGDVDNQLSRFLAQQGYLAESVGPDIAPRISEYTAVMVNLPEKITPDQFTGLVDAAASAGVGMVFTKGYWSGWGIDLLHDFYGDPASVSFSWYPGGLRGQVEMAHPEILPGKAVGDQFAVFDDWMDVASFDGYSGQNLVSLNNDFASSIGFGVGAKQNANNRHVLLASLGATYWQGPANWTEDARSIFANAVKWIAKPESDGPKFVYWNLAATPDTVLWSQQVGVTVGVKNVGTQAGAGDVALQVGEQFEGTQSLSLGSGENQTATWNVQREPVGSYKVKVGHLTTTFRVRPPKVSVSARSIFLPPSGKGRNADPGEPAIPLVGAQVDVVNGNSVISQGKLDQNGQLTFDSTASRADYTLVIRHTGYGYTRPRNYLITMPVHVEGDVAYSFAPQPADVAQFNVAMMAKNASHHGSIFVSGAALGNLAYEVPTGTLVATPGAYRIANVMAYDVPGAQWAYASDWEDRNLAVGEQSYTFGGDLALSMSDVRGQAAPQVRAGWGMADASGHQINSIYRVTAGAFGPTNNRTVKDSSTWPATIAATAATTVKPVLTLTNPAGAIAQTGPIGWAERPRQITFDTAQVMTGEYRLALQSDTGPYMGMLQANATLLLPARSFSRTLLMPGDTFEVTVVLDAGQAGALTLTESLPAGWSITKQSALPSGTFSGSTWTWSTSGKGAYRPGQTVRVTYTVRVGPNAAAGTYALTGAVGQNGGSRLVAGPQSVTVVH